VTRGKRLVRRYVAPTAVVGALCLLVAFAPTLAPRQTVVAITKTTPGVTRVGQATTVNGSASVPSAVSAGGGAAPSTHAASTPVAVTPASGCRQVAWTVYSPPCVSPPTGSNGGDTTHGVTATTITVSYRMTNSTEDAAAFAALGSPNFSDPHFVSDLQAYIDIFNKDYQLYGRHVALKAFQGTGDWLAEDQGQDLTAAQADAASAHDTGAFADLAFLYKATQPYEQDLAQENMLGIGVPGMPQAFFTQNAPWLYSPWPTGEKLAGWAVNTACQHMVGQLASFAGDAATRASKRVFGIVTLDIPGYTATGAIMQQGLDGCGADVGRRVAYAVDIPTFQNQADSIVAQMRAAGVTTVICYCDPLMPAFLSQAADQQKYNPEWMAATLGPTDQLFRYSSQTQWAHAISNQGTFPSKSQSEAYRVFQLSRPGAQPAEEFYPTAYALALELFNGLQAAGPDLTPQNFELGMFSLPTSGAGDFGTWSYGSGAFTPGTDTQVGWWSTSRVSAFDGQPGGWQNCYAGAFLPYALNERAAWGQAGTPLDCFR
jgi:hypothetical protein